MNDKEHVMAGSTRHPGWRGRTPAWIPGRARDDLSRADVRAHVQAQAEAHVRTHADARRQTQ
ncbi:MAG TPA: hypothetical protein VGD76_06625 [Ramlibacter sp.]